jgi:hypothetical protein
MGTLGELLLVLGLASELLLPPIGKSARARRAASLEAMAAAALAARRFAGTSTRRGPSPYWRCGGEAASSDEEGDENGIGGICKRLEPRRGVVRAGRERAKRALVSRQMRELEWGGKVVVIFSHLQIVPLFTPGSIERSELLIRASPC